MIARDGLWKPVTAFVLVSAAALALTGHRVVRDVVPLATIVENGDALGAAPPDTDAPWLAADPAARFVAGAPEALPFRATSDGLALIASGKGDPLVAVTTVEAAFMYVQDSARHEVVQNPPADRLAWFTDVVDRARAADPGNGWFDLQAGTKLLEAALEEVKLDDGEAPKSPPKVLDEARLRAGLARLDAAAAAPFVDSRRVERMSLRARLVPAGGMDSISGLLGTWASTLLPEIRFYRSALNARLLPWLETSAPADEAVKRIGQTTVLMKRVQKSSKALIEWLVARTVEKRALETLSRVHAAAGRLPESQEAARKARQMDRWREARDDSSWERNAGSLDSLWMASGIMGEFDTEPGRELDWAVLEEAVFASLVVMLVLWGLGGAVRAFVARRVDPAEAGAAAARPWTMRDLASVAVPGALLPAIFFIVFNRTHPSRAFGAYAAGGTYFAQALTLLPAVLLLLSWLLRRSLAGTAGAPPPRRLPAILLAVAAMVAALSFFWFNAPPSQKSALLLSLPLVSGAALAASAIAGLRWNPAGASLGRAQVAAALASVALVALAHLVVVQPHADAAIARYRSSVLEPWMQSEVRLVVQSNKVLRWEAEEETR